LTTALCAKKTISELANLFGSTEKGGALYLLKCFIWHFF